jgi:predicted Rossmann fold flavoprotein
MKSNPASSVDSSPFWDAIIVGGGAAGFFAALQLKETKPNARVLIMEKTGKLLAKVAISGGGRCNVTHACFDNKLLSTFYPRGEKELYGAFSRFAVNDTVQWFAQRGIQLKTEVDGRMFPESDDSATIVDCFIEEAQEAGIEVQFHTGLVAISANENSFSLLTQDEDTIETRTLLIATGGSPKSSGFSYLNGTGHTIIPPVPSLFTFNLPSHPLTELMGLSVEDAAVSLPDYKKTFRGPVLITHWGLSGPAVLKLSAFAARELNADNYRYKVKVNWLAAYSPEDVWDKLMERKLSRQSLGNKPFPEIPKRMWEAFLDSADLHESDKWADSSNKKLRLLADLLCGSSFVANGKTTFKDEFVTSGGVNLKEVDFRTMESKCCPGLYFAGEVLNIDGITGGFNFQAAWTTGAIAGKAIAARLDT